MDVAKYRALFVSESRDHLDGIAKALLTLERQPAERAALDDLFRHAHSIKGMAASMGYEPAARLAHKLEDLADLARRGGPLDGESVDLWLSGVDCLGEMVVLVEAGREAELVVPPLLARVEDKTARVAATQGPPPRAAGSVPAAVATVAAPAPPMPAAPAGAGGEWTIKVVIADQSSTPHVRAFLVHKRVSEKMEILGVTPAVAELRQGTLPERTLHLHVRGALDATALEALVRSIPDVKDVALTAPTAPEPAPGVPAPRPAAEDPASRTVRIRTELLDHLIDSVGEMMLARERLRSVARRLDDPALWELVDEFSRLSRGLNERVLRARMNPVSLLTDRLPRVVRDLARKHGRAVDFRVEGASIEMDRAVLDALHDPMLHLIRNGVDHAHEGPDGRRAAGKPAAMRLTVAASRDRDHVVLEVSDDGKGMDPARLRDAAVRKGILSPDEASRLSDQEALELICRPGFSTAEQVSDTSGRGVGMDVVRANLEQLGGQLLIRSTPGLGTTFTLRLPLTVAIIRVLLVSSGPDRAVYALPLNRVSRAQDYVPADVVTSQGVAMFPVDGALVPLHDLARLLGYPDRPWPAGAVLVLEQQFRPVAIHVDGISGQQEVVVKPLGEPLASVPFLSGAALLADGRPAYILDVARLLGAQEAS